MTRHPWLAAALVLLVAVGASVAFVLVRGREGAPAAPQDPERSDGLTLLVVHTRSGPFAAVIGSTGGKDGALVVPTRVQVTVPGQGDATLDEALELPARQAATTVANLLGVWIEHYVVLGRARLTTIADRADGIAVGEDLLGSAEMLAMLEEAGKGETAAFALVLGGLLDPAIAWEPPDLVEADSPSTALATLEAASGVPVLTLEVAEVASDLFRAEPEAVRQGVIDAFGGPDREVVGVVVLNGSGVPGVGELVAERIVPGGFRVVISENASAFDHDETLVVVGSADDVALGERVRDLLGVGSVNVSVSSGIAPVTVVVGKDFTG